VNAGRKYRPLELGLHAVARLGPYCRNGPTLRYVFALEAISSNSGRLVAERQYSTASIRWTLSCVGYTAPGRQCGGLNVEALSHSPEVARLLAITTPDCNSRRGNITVVRSVVWTGPVVAPARPTIAT